MTSVKRENPPACFFHTQPRSRRIVRIKNRMEVGVNVLGRRILEGLNWHMMIMNTMNI